MIPQREEGEPALIYVHRVGDALHAATQKGNRHEIATLCDAYHSAIGLLEAEILVCVSAIDQLKEKYQGPEELQLIDELKAIYHQTAKQVREVQDQFLEYQNAGVLPTTQQ